MDSSLNTIQQQEAFSPTTETFISFSNLKMNRQMTTDLERTDSGGSSCSAEGGYFSTSSQSLDGGSMEDTKDDTNNVLRYLKPQFMILGEEGGFLHKTSFWGGSIRTCQLLEEGEDGQFLPYEPSVFYHIITHVVVLSRFEEIGARPGYVLQEIQGAPTHEMNGEEFVNNITKCAENLLYPGTSAFFKFLENTEDKKKIYRFVQFCSKEGGELDIDNIKTRTSEGHHATAETDDDSDVFIRDLTTPSAHEFIIKQPRSTPDMPPYYIFSDDGSSVDVRDFLKGNDKRQLPGYMFQIDIYSGIYTGEGGITSSLCNGDTVMPLVIRLPFCNHQRVLAAGPKKGVDVADYCVLHDNIDLSDQVIHEGDPGLFLLQRVQNISANMVLRSTKDHTVFLGIDGGKLKAIRPTSHYSKDRRLHFKRLLKTCFENMLMEIVHETSV